LYWILAGTALNALPVFEIALVLMRFYHVASVIVNVNHGNM